MVGYMDDTIEKSIIELFDEFKTNPDYFIDEKNLIYKFCDIIIRKHTKEYNLRWEYFTNVHYKGHVPDPNGIPKEIDICFVENDFIDSIPYAMEFKFKRNIFKEGIDINEFYPSQFDVIDPDFEELQHPDNKINKGYIIFFSLGKIINNQEREEAHLKNKSKFFDKYEILKSKIKNDGIKIIFVCIDNIDGRNTYSIMHNLNNTFPEALNIEYSL